MHQAKLYKQANNMQRYDGQHIIKEFSSIIQWRLDGKDSLLDVGCGSGDVLMDFLYPIVPKDFKQIIGSDISLEMVRHCNETYSQMDKVDFKVLDIGAEKLPKEFISEFFHVTSFYCLHWVQNQRQALGNIYQMLQADGDCLLVFPATHLFFDVNKIVSANPKWSPYMSGANCYNSHFECSKDLGIEFGQMLKDAGFIDYSVEVRDKLFVYEGLENLRKNVRVVNPFIERIPIQMHEEFMDDIIKTTTELSSSESNNDDDNDYTFLIPYKLIVAYATKKCDFV